MNEEVAFLGVIFDAPEDNDLRLVYADWLEDHGEPRAELIRVQLALYRGGHGSERTAELRRREAELLEQFGEAWLAPLKAKGWSAEFERGLPALPRPQRIVPAPLVRNRPPRVCLTYEVPLGDPPQHELPFVVGVLADLSGQRRDGVSAADRLRAQGYAVPDLSGQRRDGVPALSARRFRAIDRDNFNAQLERVGPELYLDVPRAEGGQPLHVSLRFRGELDDFEPARVAAQVPELSRLVEERSPLLSAQLAAILHHPDFQRLEATWRGLHYLVHQTEAGPLLKIRVLDLKKEELLPALDPPAALDASILFRRVYEEEFRNLGGEPYGLLVGDYEFDHGPEDVQRLRLLARLAAHVYAPFVAAASPRLFGCDRFSELTANCDLPALFAGADYEAWRSFRASPDSRFVALTLPRVLARLPYGAASRPIEEFPFEELTGGAGEDSYLWMNAAWAHAACITNAFACHGWLAKTQGVEGGGRVDSLPVRTGPATDRSTAETAVSEPRAVELSEFGFLPLAYCGSDRDAFVTARSCHQPKPPPDPTGLALLSGLDYLLCASRFLRTLAAMVRDRVGSFLEVEDVERQLNAWLAGYVGCSKVSDTDPPLVTYFRWVLAENSKRILPLDAGRVEVRAVADKPGYHDLVVWLHPTWQLEGPGGALRLTVEVPPLQ